MKTFLQEVAEKVVREFNDWENLTVVFPNRRAALYFRKALAEQLEAPRWAPSILSVEEFIGSFSSLREKDKLSLIVDLYHTYKEVVNNEETLDHFYFWGEMLLRDFDELDKYLVPAEGLFKDLSNQKELDQYFDYLTDEQKKFLMDFWQSLAIADSDSKQKFLVLWRSLFGIYTAYRSKLSKTNSAYAGMIQRTVAEDLDKLDVPANATVVFAGFNALTTAEEKIFTWFVTHRQAKMYWDEDTFYTNTPHREAGTFFRQYRQHTVLGTTFSEPASLLGSAKEITLLGVPQKAGQPKWLGEQLEEAMKKGFTPERTVVVLPDESLLLPVLYALPASLPAINVTMGFPLVSTPYFTLVDFLFDLQINRRKNLFYFPDVLRLLNHPCVRPRLGETGTDWRNFIVKYNQVYVAQNFYREPYDASLTAPLPPTANSEAGTLLDLIFKPIEEKDFLVYGLTIITTLATLPSGAGSLENEFAFYFHRIVSRLAELIEHEPMVLRMQQRMFRQIARSEKVPFNGEPLQGLQVMGVLETRNLDFDHVIVLSLNEGLWPAAPRQGSYIPHHIRKAYQLPTEEHQDAMYAYLFYRLLHRADKVDLYYNTEPDMVGAGEMSRYLYQLIYETNWPLTRKLLYNAVSANQSIPISIDKSKEVLEKLNRYTGKELSPSALLTYLDCRLKFYFAHLLEIREPNSVEAEADARIFGNILHRVMELFYRDLRSPGGNWQIEKSDFDKVDTKLDYFIERAYRDHFRIPDRKEFVYDGSQFVVKEMVKKFAANILQYDKSQAPFTIELLELNNFNTRTTIQQGDQELTILLGGKIDRVDRLGKVVRIIDYKTGKDNNDFKSLESLFQREGKREKAIFQALFYAWVYGKRNADTISREDLQILPGLINRNAIFKPNFQFGIILEKHPLSDVKPLMPEFEERLTVLLQELFSAEQPFDQTPDVKICGYCPYREICER